MEPHVIDDGKTSCDEDELHECIVPEPPNRAPVRWFYRVLADAQDSQSETGRNKIYRIEGRQHSNKTTHHPKHAIDSFTGTS